MTSDPLLDLSASRVTVYPLTAVHELVGPPGAGRHLVVIALHDSNAETLAPAAARVVVFSNDTAALLPLLRQLGGVLSTAPGCFIVGPDNEAGDTRG